MSFISDLKFLFNILFVLGVFPYQIRHNQFIITKLSLIYTTACFIIFSILITYFSVQWMVELKSANWYFLSEFHVWLIRIHLIIVLIIYCVPVGIIIVQRKLQVEFLNRFHNLEMDFQSIQMQSKHSTFCLKICFSCILIYFIFNAMGIYFWGNDYSLFEIIFSLTHSFNVTISKLIILLIGHIAIRLVSLYRNVSSLLKLVFLKNISSNAKLKEVYKAIKLFEQLDDIKIAFSKAYSFLLLMIVGFDFSFIVTMALSWFMRLQTNNSSVLESLYFSFIYILPQCVKVYLLVNVMDLLGNQVYKACLSLRHFFLLFEKSNVCQTITPP